MSGIFNLSHLNGKNGFAVNGTTSYYSNGNSGSAVSTAGDFNGDGFNDVIIGAPSTLCDISKTCKGQSYIIFGNDKSFPSSLDLTNLDLKIGFAIDGINFGDNSGSFLGGGGDINGDGFGDVIIGAPSALNGAGQSYIVFGSKNVASTFQLSNLNGTNGFVMNGLSSGDKSGSWVSDYGDFNDDGFDDILVGAPQSENGAGEVYLLYGKKDPFDPSFNFENLNGKNGLTFQGINQAGSKLGNAGDINTDGIDDIIIGAPYALQDAGQAYVVFGSKDSMPSTFSLTNLNGTNGFTINGIQNTDYSAISVAGVGDFNGDGIDDIADGAIYALGSYPGGKGQSYVVYGQKSFPGTFDLSNLDGTNGFANNGINQGDWSGAALSGAGDFNGDGLKDVLIGAYGALGGGTSGKGQSYVIFGNKDVPMILQLSALNGENGFALNGINGGDQSGEAVSGIGDFNNDGFDDIIIGAHAALCDANSNCRGQSYVVFGTNSTLQDFWEGDIG